MGCRKVTFLSFFVRKKNRTFVGVNQIVITMSSQARRIELSRAKWREKTKLLRLELDKKNLRHAEIEQNRDSWRQKAQDYTAKIAELEAKLAQFGAEKKT